jgi:hypothetical protein
MSPPAEMPSPSAPEPAAASPGVSAEGTASETNVTVPVEEAAELNSRAAPVQPVELPSEPTGEMEVASHLELMDWRQSETADTGASSEPASPWARRAIEVDFSAQEASSTEAGFSNTDGEIPLASVHEFIPSWDPSAEPQEGAGGPSASPEGAGPEDSQLQPVQFQDALEALRQVTTRGALGQVLLSYCQGRYPRGFLLGETVGFARVGRGYGPGSNKPAVSALQVDLDAPSLLAMAAAGGRAVVSSVPESQEDEALFAALGESFSHLMAAPIRASQRTVGFIVIDSGPSPFGAEELDELEQLLAVASEVYGRLIDSSL